MIMDRMIAAALCISMAGCHLLSSGEPAWERTEITLDEAPEAVIESFYQQRPERSFQHIYKRHVGDDVLYYEFTLPDGSSLQFTPDGRKSLGGVI